VVDRCRTDEPPLQEVQPGHLVACHLREVGVPPKKLTPTRDDVTVPTG